MDINYTVRGADGKEYGPVSLEQLTKWIDEGRLTPKQQVRRTDMEHWAEAGEFTELQPLFVPATSEAAPAAVNRGAAAQPDAVALSHIKSGASWFYWIAGLSLINSISEFSGGSWRFMFGLGITQILDRFTGVFGGAAAAVALAIGLLAAGFLVACGVFASKGRSWTFLVGLVFIGLDGIASVLTASWLGVALHALVLFYLFRGFQASRRFARG